MDLSIVILNYKQKGLIKYCLKRLLSYTLPLEHEIIVVDNDSHDNIETLMRNEFLRARLIKAKNNRGYAAGNNLGLKNAKGKYVLILNPDVTINEEAIAELYRFMETHPQAGIAGPKIFNPDGSLQYTCLKFPDWKLPFYRRTFLGGTKKGKEWNRKYQMADWDHDTDKKVDWLFGACFIIRKEALPKVGLLDERYFLYMEDLDWCRRFWENNWEVWYAAKPTAIHFLHRQSAEGNVLKALFSKTGRAHLLSWLKYYIKFRNKKLPEIE